MSHHDHEHPGRPDKPHLPDRPPTADELEIEQFRSWLDSDLLIQIVVRKWTEAINGL